MAEEQKQKLKTPGEANAAYLEYINNGRAGAGAAPFRYDWNGDALYQQAAQRYQQLGRQAMMDTMGQASALTGGYGNSYAQNAGQQAYQGYLQGLHDQLPQYQQMAMNQYKLDYAQYEENQKQARAQADYLMSMGIRPDDELLTMAGYGSQYVDRRVPFPIWNSLFSSLASVVKEKKPEKTEQPEPSLAEKAATMIDQEGLTDSQARQQLLAQGYSSVKVNGALKQKKIIDSLFE